MVNRSRSLVRVALVWAVVTLVWCAVWIEWARAQEPCPSGTISIDRYGFLCLPGTGEIFVEEAHDGYTQWMQPHNPTASCCNNQDCAPVDARYDEVRKVYQAKIDGEWRDIPPEIILDPRKPENHSPDGSFHACWNRSTGKLLCFREAEPKI